jgi:hypothetical protein
MSSAHVAVLIHHEHEFIRHGYLLEELSLIWRERGIDLSVLQGPSESLTADALILHVDLTRVPANYMRFVEQHPVVINRRVADISKRLVSRNIVNQHDGWDGPVIVKTDANYGGLTAAVSLKSSRRHGEAIVSRFPSRWSKRSTLRTYDVFDSVSKIPSGVWDNPNLIVERFLPERRNGQYCLRTWLFLGKEERIAIFYSNNPVVKSVNIIGRDVITDVPDDLREMRRELGFDFGKFDFVVADGKTVLFDANRTPTIGAIPRAQYLPWLGKLASGISTFLPGTA